MRYNTRFWFLFATVLALAVVILPIVGLGQRSQRSTGPSQRRPPIDYSKFSHSTAKHQGACNTCHKIPTKNWQKVATFPDVADFPDHDACVSCHRSQFFKGPKPPICSVCHSRTSPKDDARFSFGNPAAQLQFTIEFPHDKHQGVIATLMRIDNVARAFSHAQRADDKTDPYNNCTICHAPRTSPLKPPGSGWPDGVVPSLATFKSSPSNHASCFNCHFKAQKPTAIECNGCHKLATPYFRVEAPNRISLKFIHDGGGEKKNHVLECTSCHINITKAASLRGLQPDVPITSCTECHNKDGLRLDVSKELAAIDKNRSFVCSYCHTSNVGSLDPPSSHYLIAERPPLKRKDIK